MFFIYYDTKDITKTIGSGVFYCCKCNAEQPYWHKTLQEKARLYFVSILALTGKVEIVHCRGCDAIYEADALAFRPGPAQTYYPTKFESCLLRLMALMMLADGAVDEPEVEMLISVFEEVSGHRLTPQEVMNEVAAMQSSDMTVADYTEALNRVLDNDAREFVIQAVYLIACADETLDAAESELVSEIATGLGLKKRALNAALAQLQDGP